MRITLAILAAAALLAGCGTPAAVPAAPQPAPQPAAFPAAPPELGPAPTVDVPDPERRTLANGLEVMYVRRPQLPVVAATLVVRGAGTAEDPAALPGLATFTADMMDEGAAGRSALELADAIDNLGASLFTHASWDAAGANLYVLRANFDAALGLMADVVVRPDFPDAEVQRLRDQRLTTLARARDEPAQIAGNAFQALVFGGQHPYGRVETTATARTLERPAVARFHGERFRPDAATLVLVGDVDPAVHHPVVERAFGGWRAAGAAAASTPLPEAPEVARTRIYLIDKPGAAQSEIRIGHPGVARSHPDYYAIQVMNTLLGGSFTSRLNNNLRETHGYTYGAGSGFAMRMGAGPFTARSAVRTNATDSALVQFFHELERIREEPIPAEDLDKARRYLALGFPLQLETNRAIAARFGEVATYGLDPSFLDTYVQRIMAVTADDVRRVAREHVRPDQAVVVIVGDRGAVEGPVRALDMVPVEIRDAAEFVQ